MDMPMENNSIEYGINQYPLLLQFMMLKAFLFFTISTIVSTDTLIDSLEIQSCLDDGNKKYANDGWLD
jgi:hypothetical protein